MLSKTFKGASESKASIVTSPTTVLVAFLSKSSTKYPIPLIDYRPTYINTKDYLDFTLMKIKEYYNTHY